MVAGKVMLTRHLVPVEFSKPRLLGGGCSTRQLDCFYSSDLERARHTSRLVGGPSGWNPEFMESLRERDPGVLEGLTTDEMKVKYPQEYQSFRNDGPEYQVPGGESFQQFYDRCSGALEEVATRNPRQKNRSGYPWRIFGCYLPVCLEYTA